MKKDKNSIAVIGQGFVGGSLTQVFSERGFIVYTCDKKGISAPGSYNGSVWSLKSMVDFAERVSPTKDHCFLSTYFVCVPTPMRKTGAADLSIVESVLQELANIPGERVAVVKSTVPPGSTDSWNKRFNESGLTVVFCPEFLTEANALEDMRNQTRIIVGGPRPASSRVKDVFRRAFPDTPIIKTGSTTAEMVKYFTNSFLSTKVSFANEIYQICESLNIDYDKVVEYALYDERIGKTHLSVPGPDGSLGFGGHCFPKDLGALIFLANSLGITPSVLQGVRDKNDEVRVDRDWERQIGRAVSEE